MDPTELFPIRWFSFIAVRIHDKTHSPQLGFAMNSFIEVKDYEIDNGSNRIKFIATIRNEFIH